MVFLMGCSHERATNLMRKCPRHPHVTLEDTNAKSNEISLFYVENTIEI